MMHIVPTLNFSGRCRDAIHLYEKAFGGKITCLITYREADDPMYNPLLNEDQRDWIYHAELALDDQRIIMCDNVTVPFKTSYATFLTVMCDEKEDVEKAYAIRKEGSRTIYPLIAVPYSSGRVVFVDRYGIRWVIMTERARQ